MSDVVRVSQSQPSDRCKPRLGHVTLKAELQNTSVTLHTGLSKSSVHFVTWNCSVLCLARSVRITLYPAKLCFFFYKQTFYARNSSSIVAVVASRTNASNPTLQVIVRCSVLAVFMVFVVAIKISNKKHFYTDIGLYENS